MTKHDPFQRLNPYRGYGLICMILDEMGGSARWETLHIELCDRLGLRQREEPVADYELKIGRKKKTQRNVRGHYASYFTYYNQRPGRYYTKDGVDHSARGWRSARVGHRTHGVWRLNDTGRELVAWLKKGIAENRWKRPEHLRLWEASAGTRWRIERMPDIEPERTLMVVRTAIEPYFDKDLDDPILMTNAWLVMVPDEDDEEVLSGARFEVGHGHEEFRYTGERVYGDWHYFYTFRWRNREVLLRAASDGRIGTQFVPVTVKRIED